MDIATGFEYARDLLDLVGPLMTLIVGLGVAGYVVSLLYGLMAKK